MFCWWGGLPGDCFRLLLLIVRSIKVHGIKYREVRQQSRYSHGSIQLTIAYWETPGLVKLIWIRSEWLLELRSALMSYILTWCCCNLVASRLGYLYWSFAFVREPDWNLFRIPFWKNIRDFSGFLFNFSRLTKTSFRHIFGREFKTVDNWHPSRESDRLELRRICQFTWLSVDILSEV